MLKILQWLIKILPTSLNRKIAAKIIYPLILNHPDTIQAAGKPGSPNPWWQRLERASNRQIFRVPDYSVKHICAEIYEAYRPMLSQYNIDLNQFFLGSIKTEDAEVLYQLVREKRPRIVYQIGTFAGYSALVIAHALHANGRGKLIAVDPEIPHRTLINPVNIARDLAKDQGLDEYILFVRGWHALTSVDYIAEGLKREVPIVGLDILTQLDGTVDFAFIDGNHSTSCTLADFLLLKDFLSLGSVTVFHDAFSWPTVAQALYILLHDIYYYEQGIRAYFTLDVRRGIDGLVALERIANETFPTMQITVVESQQNTPLPNVTVRLSALNYEAVTGQDGMAYILTEVPSKSFVEVSHPDYQPYQGFLDGETAGDFAKITIRLVPLNLSRNFF